MRTRRGWLVTVLLGLVVAGATPQAALASPPANDNFANADPITSLPFTDSGDLAGTTSEPGEPAPACVPGGVQTVWYVFTPSTSESVKVDLAGSDFSVSGAAYQALGPGFGGLNFLGCMGGIGSPPFVLPVTAGSTYYFQVGLFFPGPSHMSFHLEAVAPPPNDAFANAEALGPVPDTATVDLTAATLEAGEPVPTAAGMPITASAWYVYTPSTSGKLLLRMSPSVATVVSVYTGASVDQLTQVVSGSGPFPPVIFSADAGATYHIQVGTNFIGGGGPVLSLTLEEVGPPTASFVYFPFDPSVYDNVQFFDTSFDPAFIGFGPIQWDFGDGTTATGCCPTHRYAADGDYTVSLTVTTHDGRTASTTQPLTVRTHDVSIERIQAPNSTRVGQTKNVAVNVRGGRYAETVQVDLYKSVAGGPEQFVASQTQPVPVAHGGRTTGFDFPYTFTADDGTVGKVTFRPRPPSWVLATPFPPTTRPSLPPPR